MISRQLRGTKPKTSKRRLKAFIYGESGSGKSYFCTHFPKPYYIDSEKGAEWAKYVENIEQREGVVFQTRNFREIYEEVSLLATTEHDYQTLIIDPITPIYDNLLDECLAKLKGRSGYGQHYGEANKQFKKLIDLLLTIDMNVVVTAHVKKEYGSDMNVVGTTFDAYKKFNFLFDVVIETMVRKGRYIGISKKSRLVSLGADEEFDFSYQEFSKLYRHELEYFVPKPIAGVREAVNSKPSLSLIETAVTQGTKDHLVFLIQHLQLTDEQIDEWLGKLRVSNIAELTEEKAQRQIAKIVEKHGDAEQAWLDLLAARNEVEGESHA